MKLIATRDRQGWESMSLATIPEDELNRGKYIWTRLYPFLLTKLDNVNTRSQKDQMGQ